MIAAIPPGAAVLSDHKLAPQLSMREQLYLINWTESPYYEIGDIDFIALDLGHAIRSGGPDFLVAETKRLLKEFAPDGPAERIAAMIPEERRNFLAEAGCADFEGARRAAGAGIRNRVFQRTPWTLKKDFSEQVAVAYDLSLHLDPGDNTRRFNISQMASLYSAKIPIVREQGPRSATRLRRRCSCSSGRQSYP